MRASGNFHSERQDFRILVAPVGAVLIGFVLCYPLTSYLELPPESAAAGIIPEESGWHLGIVPLWQYDHYSIASWHPANIIILLGLLSLWVACFFLARKL